MVFQEVRFKVHDPKAHSKGGTLENTINGGRSGGDDENPGPPPHILHPGKVTEDLTLSKYTNNVKFIIVLLCEQQSLRTILVKICCALL